MRFIRFIPCAISLLRAAAIIPIFMLLPQNPAAAFSVFIAAAASDFLDGFLARKMNAENECGKILDPLADKILYLGSLVTLRNAAPALWLLFAPALVLEISLAAVRFLRPYCENRAANPCGKIKTAFQFCAIFCAMFGIATETALPAALGFSLGIAAIPLAGISLLTRIRPGENFK